MVGLKFALEHNLMYEISGDFTNKYFNYAYPTDSEYSTDTSSGRFSCTIDTLTLIILYISRVRVVEIFIYETSCYLIH